MHCNCKIASIALLAVLSVASSGQAPATPDPQRTKAFELYKQFKPIEALPMFAELAKKYPTDIAVQESYGVCLIADAAGLTDDNRRKEERAQAYTVLQYAKQLGDNSDLMNTLLAGLPADGSMPTFSSNQEVEDAMRQGEAAFARGDSEKAIANYTRALLTDPKQYYAALFIGDVYFKKGEQGSAGEWFQRAIEIDPNIETAYRYWGDALSQVGRSEEARNRYIQAVVADPYNRTAWVGLVGWAQRNGVKLSQPRIDTPQTTQRPNGEVQLTIDAKNFMGKGIEDGTSLWILYPGIRIVWKKQRFAEHYPKEKAYRHSLGEETDAFRSVAEAVVREQKEGKIKSLDPQLATLEKLNDEQLIEPYVLLARPDEGIAQDYVGYREAHRDLLIHYIQEYVAPLPSSSKVPVPQS